MGNLIFANIRIPKKTNQDSMESRRFLFFFVAQMALALDPQNPQNSSFVFFFFRGAFPCLFKKNKLVGNFSIFLFWVWMIPCHFWGSILGIH